VSDEVWAYKAIIEDIRKRSDADYSSLKQATDVEIEQVRETAAREIAQCYADLREKDAEIERLRSGIRSASKDVSRLVENEGKLGDEIERLKAENELLRKDYLENTISEIDRLKETNFEKDAEIKRLENRVSDLTRDCIYGHKVLLTRAADALGETHVGKAGLGCQVCDLIQELREVAK
jgi:predicted RNase H-like nuclease (RuvC/YqgF family)